MVPTESIAKMRGSTLDLNRDLVQGGMAIQNPNTPPAPVDASPAMAGVPVDLNGDVAQRVVQVLEQQINPSIAAHGGRADLVAVEGDAVYLRLSGGCAGCGMAAVTLSQGIEVALRESVPEITRVIDVTDHAAGTNPYYEAEDLIRAAPDIEGALRAEAVGGRGHGGSLAQPGESLSSSHGPWRAALGG